jgi:preprotein translocase subunit SecF
MNIFPYDSKIDFLRLRTLALTITVALLIAATALLATRGLNYALDFTGGMVAEVRFEKPVNLDQVREKLEAAGYQGAIVQALASETDLVVRLQPEEARAAGQPETQDTSPTAENAAAQTGGAVLEVISTPDTPGQLVRSDLVGPQVGSELAYNGIVAVIFVAVGFMIYIVLRFEWKYAVSAIATTMFDVIVTTGFFALIQREFDLAVLAGILSVMGYSINDKIVVFDRVRENFRALHKIAPIEVLNRSVNQTLSRTVITSFVAFLNVLALYIYGGSSLEGMAASQMFGIVLGTLSSIFVACPLLYWLGASKQDLMPKARDEAELARRP